MVVLGVQLRARDGQQAALTRGSSLNFFGEIHINLIKIKGDKYNKLYKERELGFPLASSISKYRFC